MIKSHLDHQDHIEDTNGPIMGYIIWSNNFTLEF